MTPAVRIVVRLVSVILPTTIAVQLGIAIHLRNSDSVVTIVPLGAELFGVGVSVGVRVAIVGKGLFGGLEGVLVGVSEGLTVGEVISGVFVGEFVTVGDDNSTVGDGVSDSEANAVLVHVLVSVSLGDGLIIS